MVIYVFASVLFCLILAISFRLRNTLTGNIRGIGFGSSSGIGEERSPLFYAPMERLLSEEDFRFLKGRVEIPKSSIRRLRDDRRKMFRRYLGCLSVDFASIVKELRAIMVQSDVPRPDLAQSLFRAQFLFALAVLAIEARLLLHACGIYTISISAAPLTEGLASMQAALLQMQGLPAPSAS